jgi:hypothetical protein
MSDTKKNNPPPPRELVDLNKGQGVTSVPLQPSQSSSGPLTQPAPAPKRGK